jgi:hypothetical protein
MSSAIPEKKKPGRKQLFPDTGGDRIDFRFPTPVVEAAKRNPEGARKALQKWADEERLIGLPYFELTVSRHRSEGMQIEKMVTVMGGYQRTEDRGVVTGMDGESYVVVLIGAPNGTSIEAKEAARTQAIEYAKKVWKDVTP